VKILFWTKMKLIREGSSNGYRAEGADEEDAGRAI
jgi:hypothetical protein